ncbi:MAG TPA: type II secretion system F family protein [Propionibacteriaceae bacterium]|nr:type II secretion system F family protein [Propionibacteriaceae bacterium]
MAETMSPPLITPTPSGLDQLSLTALLCAAFTGLAAFLLLDHPVGQLRRITRGRSKLAAVAAPMLRLIRGRGDAPPLIRRLLLSMLGVLALALAAARIDGWQGDLLWFALPVVAATGVLALGWLEPRSARRRREQLIMEVPQALELLAACLGAGLPARTACAAVVRTFDGPVADDLGQVMVLLELGVGDVVAWQALHDHPQLGLAAADLARSVESGTSMVQGLRHHAAAAREVRRSERQVLARAVGVRSVLPLMMCFIPSFLLLGIIPAVVSAVFNALP